MRVALVVALLDLRRRLRDRTAIGTAFVAPLVLATIMGLAFGDDGGGGRARIAIADPDQSPVSRAFVDDSITAMSLGSGVEVVRVGSEDEARRLYETRGAVLAIALRPGFSADAGGDPVSRVYSSDERPLSESLADAVAAGLRWRGATAAPVSPAATQILEENLAAQGSPLGYFGPSMAIVFLFMLVGITANGLLAERVTGTMARLQVAPVGIGSVIAGKTASIVGLMLISVLSLWGATTLLFGARWGDTLGVFAMAAASVAAVGALGLFVTVASRSEGVAQVAAVGVGFVLALLGGNFFPPGSLPLFLERLSLLTPNGWALEGFTTLSLDRGTMADVVQPVVILAVMAFVIGTAALIRLRTRVVVQ